MEVDDGADIHEYVRNKPFGALRQSIRVNTFSLTQNTQANNTLKPLQNLNAGLPYSTIL